MDDRPKSASATRLLGFDVARAFAILGMVSINFQVFLLHPRDASGALAHYLADLPSGRASSLFVTLAGVGIALLARGASPRAVRFTLLRRALFLLIAGNLLILVWWIDILHFYAFYLALSALIFLWLPRKVLLPLAAVIIAIPPVIRAVFPDIARPDADEYWTPLGMLKNVVGWGVHPLFPWLAFVLLGLFLSSYDFAHVATRRRIFLVGALVAIATPLLSFVLQRAFTSDPWMAAHAMPLASTDWSPAPLFVIGASGTATVAICVAHEVAARWPTARFVRALASTGQLSFTIYILHALVGVGIPRWIFHLEDGMRLGPLLACAAGFCVVVIPLAALWRRRFARGPIEWIMRKITGATPPRITSIPGIRVSDDERSAAWSTPLLYAVVGAGFASVLVLRVVGSELRWGCPPIVDVGSAETGELTLSCTRQGFLLDVEAASDVTLETHSGMDLYLELYDGATRLGGNDDSGEGFDAKIRTTLGPGRYLVIVRPFHAAEGAFGLTREDHSPSPESPGCTNTCASSHDDECDDGGPESLYSVCELGTDCADCGARAEADRRE